MTLPNRIRDFIAKHQAGDFVPLSRITEAATSKGFTKLEVLDALKDVHKMKDVQTIVVEDTTKYRIRQALPQKRAPDRYRYTMTEADKAVLQDCIDNCPFFTDEEREALRTPFRDRTDRQHEITDTSAGYHLTMERKYGAPNWKRMCGQGAFGGMV